MKPLKYYIPIGMIIIGFFNLTILSCGNENDRKIDNLKKESPAPSAISPTPSIIKADSNPITKYVNQEFIDAVTDNNIELVTKYLIDGIDPNVEDSYEFSRRTGLHYAAGRGDIDMMKLLVKHGADINRKDINSVRPIHLSISFNQLKAVEILIESGADINATDIQNRTPLYYAVEFKNNEIAEYLLKKGADCTIDSFTGYGPPSGKVKSVYDMAKENQDERMIKLLDTLCLKKTK